MIAKVLAFFAFLAVAFASPKPDVLTYAAPGLAPIAPVAAYPYSGYPYAASAYPYAAAAYPYGYSAYSGYYVK